MTDSIVINEVGPRDGLQSQKKHLDLDQRKSLVDALVRSGLKNIEIGSFVSPKAVPQMAGTGELLQSLSQANDLTYSVLVPNQKGYELARMAGAKAVALVVSATETMSQKNIRMSVEQSFATAEGIIHEAKLDSISIQAYLSVAFVCPFEGSVSASLVRDQARQLAEFGADEIVIADTIGAADPAAVRDLMNGLVEEYGSDRLACHFHDTRAMGLANVYAAIESGVRKFDSSIGGLGGCPFAPGAKGNVATEDVVMMCHQMGFETGIDISILLKVVELVSSLTESQQGGRAHYWLSNNVA